MPRVIIFLTSSLKITKRERFSFYIHRHIFQSLKRTFTS